MDTIWIDYLNEDAELDFYGISISESFYMNIDGDNTNCVILPTSFMIFASRAVRC